MKMHKLSQSRFTMPPGISKLILTIHIIFSVGWLGALAGFIALNIAGLTCHNAQVIQSAYLAMDLIGWYIILPSCLGALLTGLIQSLGTKWGLFKHYWILVKFFLTVGSALLLLLHMQTITIAAKIASEAKLPNPELHSTGIQLLTKATAALLVLLATTTISVYKPWGRIQYELPKKQVQPKVVPGYKQAAKKAWGPYILFGIIGLLVLFIIIHLMGGGFGSHH